MSKNAEIVGNYAAFPASSAWNENVAQKPFFFREIRPCLSRAHLNISRKMEKGGKPTKRTRLLNFTTKIFSFSSAFFPDFFN